MKIFFIPTSSSIMPFYIVVGLINTVGIWHSPGQTNVLWEDVILSAGSTEPEASVGKVANCDAVYNT